MAYVVVLSIIYCGLVQALATLTPEPDVVHGKVGSDVTLTVRPQGDHSVIAQTWNKLYGGVHSMRLAVYMYSPTTGTAMSLGPLEGRASLGEYGSLVIHDAEKEDEGLYVLTSLVDVVGQEEQYFDLKMHVPPQISFGQQSPLHVVQHSQVYLNCTFRYAKSSTAHDIQWLKDGSRLWGRVTIIGRATQGMRFTNYHREGNGRHMEVETVRESDDLWTSVLTFQSVRKEDTGNYSCHAQHKDGAVAASLYLEVYYAAKITNISDSPQVVSAGSNVTLECTAQGNPPPIIAWHKEDDHTPLRSTFSDANGETGRLNLTLMKLDDNASGNYTCVATNGVPMGKKDRRTVQVYVLKVTDKSPPPPIVISSPKPKTEAISITTTVATQGATIEEKASLPPVEEAKPPVQEVQPPAVEVKPPVQEVEPPDGNLEADDPFYATFVTVGIVTVTAFSLLLLMIVAVLLCRRTSSSTKVMRTHISGDVIRHRPLNPDVYANVYR
ncbi:immunoglobulin superfamily DCC subclass member 4-like [Branchiostoma lanceolatum]|uniref:immunoglobulin superfamily DCC subclass member 4-like n=1 Tax=Branchiostoma lanceolatum TaxID=7740 RepID=UPI0034530365